MEDFFNYISIASGRTRLLAVEQERPPPDNFYILPPDPQAWRQVHASCKRQNMVICVEVTKDSHQGSRSVRPMFVDLAREISNVPFFRIKIGFGQTFDQLRDDLGGIKHSPTVIVVFYDDDGMRILSVEGVEEVRLAMRTGRFKIKIRHFLKQRAKLKFAEELAHHSNNEMEERQKRARLEYEQKLRKERERERMEELRRQQEELKRQQEEAEREQKHKEELCRRRSQAMDKLMKMDLNTARIRDIKEVMSKLGIRYVGLYERKELIDELKANVPELRTKPESQQSSSPTQSYRYVH